MANKKYAGRSTVYNEICSPEKLKAVNPENTELQKDFLDYLSSTGKSKATIYQYGNNLKIFWCWNLEFNNNKLFTNIKKRDFAKFQNHALTVWGWSPKRLRTVKATLSSMGNFIENILDDEFIGYKSVVNKIESPHDDPVREKTIFTINELQRLLDYLVENEMYEQACALSLAMNSGRRLSEIPRFKVSYFDKSNLICEGALYKTPEKIVTKGRGIDGKLLYVYTLAKPFQPYLDLWLEERKKLKVKSDWLFPARKNKKWIDKPITDQTMTYWAECFTKILKKPFYWHSIRHFFTTRLSEANIPHSVIKDIQGWESVDMVECYVDTQTEKKLDRYFGSEGIKDVKSIGLPEL